MGDLREIFFMQRWFELKGDVMNYERCEQFLRNLKLQRILSKLRRILSAAGALASVERIVLMLTHHS